MTTWPQILGELTARRDLDAEHTAWIMDQVLSGEASGVVVAGCLVGLATKGPTVGEVEGFVDSMLDHAHLIEVPDAALDIVGTGGDGSHSVNVSSMASIVAAGAGLRVVKHGNRAASSRSGSADVLAELGVNLELDPARVAEVASEVGITFCFAQVFHPAMRFAAPIRKELGIPTVFNVLGPLTNPAQPRASAIGVASAQLAPIVAGVLARRGRRGLVFRGDDGLDELAATAPATVWEVADGAVAEQRLDVVADLGMTPICLDDLRGGDAAFNAGVTRAVLEGQGGPVRDTVVLNAAAGLVADGTLAGTGQGSLVERFAAGVEHAADAIDSGRAVAVLDAWVAATQ